MKRLQTITLTGKGWLLFCPIYLPEGWQDSPELCPIPRWHLWWLLSAAFAVQQGINHIVALIDPEACGFWCFAKPMWPRTITLEVDY